MHVGIANLRWRGKRSRHSRRMCNPQFYVSGKRPIHNECMSSWYKSCKNSYSFTLQAKVHSSHIQGTCQLSCRELCKLRLDRIIRIKAWGSRISMRFQLTIYETFPWSQVSLVLASKIDQSPVMDLLPWSNAHQYVNISNAFHWHKVASKCTPLEKRGALSGLCPFL